ncbi:MAG: S41 family peptidase [Patescibacteria group bacterium]
MQIKPSVKSVLKNLGIAGVTAFVVAIGFFAGLYVNAEKVSVTFAGGNQADVSAIDMSLFYKAMQVLDDKFVSSATSTATTTDQDKLYGAIKGLAESYGDPYTTFLTPKEAKSLTGDLSGSLDGIGAVLGIKDTFLTVISTIKSSPAEKVGLVAADKIMKVDGKSTVGMDIDTAVGLIRGKKGTTVNLEISRQGVASGFNVSIVRDTITAPIVETERHPNSVFVIKVSSFTSNLPDLFRDALREYVNSGYSHLVIDLRNNTGGYLDAAVDMASWFLPTGDTVVTENFGGKAEANIYRSKGYDLFPKNSKIVILVNEYSASASEIFAGALHDRGVAKLVGKQTYGKGSVQELVPLTEDTILKITIARWLTPNGTSISHSGITPDYAVDLSLDDVKAGKDPQMDKAISVAQGL